MKKYIAIIAVCIAIFTVAVSAEAGYTCDVALCYDGDVYAVDYVFDVLTEVDILSVLANDTNCIYDWNFVKDEARLYISLASASPISKGKTIATVGVSSETVLVAVSVTVNGNIKDNVFAYHTDGDTCAKCGVVLTEPEPDVITGDFNGSGEADIQDVLILLQALLNNTPLEGADISGDNAFSLLDVLRLLKMVVKQK